jgi:hypothetical protein
MPGNAGVELSKHRFTMYQAKDCGRDNVQLFYA